MLRERPHFERTPVLEARLQPSRESGGFSREALCQLLLALGFTYRLDTVATYPSLHGEPTTLPLDEDFCILQEVPPLQEPLASVVPRPGSVLVGCLMASRGHEAVGIAPGIAYDSKNLQPVRVAWETMLPDEVMAAVFHRSRRTERVMKELDLCFVSEELLHASPAVVETRARTLLMAALRPVAHVVLPPFVNTGAPTEELPARLSRTVRVQLVRDADSPDLYAVWIEHGRQTHAVLFQPKEHTDDDMALKITWNLPGSHDHPETLKVVWKPDSGGLQESIYIDDRERYIVWSQFHRWYPTALQFLQDLPAGVLSRDPHLRTMVPAIRVLLGRHVPFDG